MKKYYEIKNSDLRRCPVKVLSEKENDVKVKRLDDGEIIDIPKSKLIEISITSLHVEKLGFQNGKRGNIYVIGTYMQISDDIARLVWPYYGYVVFKENDLEKNRNLYREVRNSLIEEYSKNKNADEVLRDEGGVIQKKFKSTYLINELLERLSDFGITYNEAEIDKIILGY